MTDTAQQSAREVAALFAERQRFESWLATLEAKRALTPVHIYTRVHADYMARLQRVNEHLGMHRMALREMESTLTDRLTSLDIDEAKYRDEFAEADLRANVGELPAEEHREVLERTALALEQLTGERLKLMQELTNLRAMLGDDGEIGVLEIGTSELTVTPTPPAMPIAVAAGAPPESRDEWPAEAPPAAASGEPDTWGLAPEDPLAIPQRANAPRPAEDLTPSSPFDDLEFLRSMMEARNTGEHATIGNGSTPPAAPPPFERDPAPVTPAAAAASAKPTAKDAAEAKAKAKEPAPTTAPAPAKKTAPAPAAKALPAAPAGSSTSTLRILDPSVSMEFVTVPASPRVPSETVPSYLRDVAPEQVKTLKCQECGTLNYPTEWYCERCGAELAAL